MPLSVANSEWGFSALEVVVCLGISLLLLGGTLVGNLAVSDSFKREQAFSKLNADIRRARDEALSSGSRVAIIINDDLTGYNIGKDFFPYESDAEIEEQILSTAFPAEITAEDDIALIFDSRGFLVDGDGEPTQASIALKQRGEVFTSASIYPTGFVCQGCD